jgi:hypothetical protein
MNTTSTTRAVAVGLVSAVLALGTTACSSGPVAPAKIRQDSQKVDTRPAPQPSDACPLHAACAR